MISEITFGRKHQQKISFQINKFYRNFEMKWAISIYCHG